MAARTNAVMRKQSGARLWSSQVLERGHGRAPASQFQAQRVPATRAQGREQELNHAWRELPELVGLHTVQLDRGGVPT